MKDQKTVIAEFNELVNMTADDLTAWLKSGSSNSAGWPKDDADGEGETVGHNSGRKIVDILNANPDKSDDKYTEDQILHMRKVVAYCKRHLAQQTQGSKEKSAEEVKKTKYYASLKNWGHDILKAQEAGDGGNTSKDSSHPEATKSDDTRGAHAGTKRKNSHTSSGANKKHETRSQAARKSSASASAKAEKKPQGQKDSESDTDHQNGTEDLDDSENNDESEHTSVDEEADDQKDQNKGSAQGPSKGDTVSWPWGAGHPEGEVLDVKEQKATITTKRGNEVSRKGTKDDPAVIIDAGKSKAIKLSHELD
ncbi:DNA-binding protein [Dactylonectria estremocensis]|uniref:DNA-binding protein n=1 Tax=Dactylonectria estremocensis TaxID=1079267 RepID=A0A9P9D7X9_9HYPO|nr:DNA-binding protein [Dactylonectria estremocensis]